MLLIYSNIPPRKLILTFLKSNNALYQEWSLWCKFFGKVLVIVGPKFSGKSSALPKLLQYFHSFNGIDNNIIEQQTICIVERQLLQDILQLASKVLKIKINSYVELIMLPTNALTITQISALKYFKQNCENIINSHLYQQLLVQTSFDLYYQASKFYIFSGRNVIINNPWYNVDSYQQFHACFYFYPYLKVALLFNTLANTLNDCMLTNKKFLKSIIRSAKNYPEIMEIINSMKFHDNLSYSFLEPVEMLNEYLDFYQFNSEVNSIKNPLNLLDRSAYKQALYAINSQQINLLRMFLANRISRPIKCLTVLPEQQTKMFFNTHHIYYIFSKFPYDFLLTSEDIMQLNSYNQKIEVNSNLYYIITWARAINIAENAVIFQKPENNNYKSFACLPK